DAAWYLRRSLGHNATQCHGDDCPAIFATDRGTLAVQGRAVDKTLPMVRKWWRFHWICCGRLSVRLDGEQVRTFFDSFQDEAFRLETLPVYKVAGEQEELQAFLETGHLDFQEDDEWYVRVRHFRETGRWIGRVHVITQPLTEYLRFEFACYPYNV